MSIQYFLANNLPEIDSAEKERFLALCQPEQSSTEHVLSNGSKEVTVTLPSTEFNKEKIEEGIARLREKGMNSEDEASLRNIISIEERDEMQIRNNQEAESILLLLRSTDFNKKTIEGCFAILDAKEGEMINFEPVLDLMKEGVKRPNAMPLIMALVSYLGEIYNS